MRKWARVRFAYCGRARQMTAGGFGGQWFLSPVRPPSSDRAAMLLLLLLFEGLVQRGASLEGRKSPGKIPEAGHSGVMFWGNLQEGELLPQDALGVCMPGGLQAKHLAPSHFLCLVWGRGRQPGEQGGLRDQVQSV